MTLPTDLAFMNYASPQFEFAGARDPDDSRRGLSDNSRSRSTLQDPLVSNERIKRYFFNV
jgi:hypothetical protein